MLRIADSKYTFCSCCFFSFPHFVYKTDIQPICSQSICGCDFVNDLWFPVQFTTTTDHIDLWNTNRHTDSNITFWIIEITVAKRMTECNRGRTQPNIQFNNRNINETVHIVRQRKWKMRFEINMNLLFSFKCTVQCIKHGSSRVHSAISVYLIFLFIFSLHGFEWHEIKTICSVDAKCEMCFQLEAPA